MLVEYNKKTEEWVFSLPRWKFPRYLLFEIKTTCWALPLYIAKHWSGFDSKDLSRISFHLSILCFHFEINNVGPIIKD